MSFLKAKITPAEAFGQVEASERAIKELQAAGHDKYSPEMMEQTRARDIALERMRKADREVHGRTPSRTVQFAGKAHDTGDPVIEANSRGLDGVKEQAALRRAAALDLTKLADSNYRKRDV